MGKTTFGLHFVRHASAAEPGLLFGFYERPERLRQKAAQLGIDLWQTWKPRAPWKSSGSPRRRAN
ncbi:hypothetical protein [Azospirillum halopraeferens]|uniref:hypothetical protein n=1 Tax=Azospirillum halopraeferens TaxID=34010 RepID=UPI0012EC8B8C